MSESLHGQEVEYTGTRRRASLILLVLVNLLPLAGVLFFNWDVAALVVLYWSENLVLGFFTLLKMLSTSLTGGLGMGLFFCIHYGGFCAGHGMFILLMMMDVDVDPMGDDPWPLFLVFPQMLINVVRAVLDHAPPQWMFVFIALYISHGASFLLNFLFGPERQTARLNKLMREPYNRIVVLHIAIIFGGFAVMALGQPVAMLLVLVLLKIALDIRLHLREHRGKPSQ